MENTELMTINEGIKTAVEIVEATSNSKGFNKATTFGLGMVGAKVKNLCENRKAKHVATVSKKMEGEVVEDEDVIEEYDE